MDVLEGRAGAANFSIRGLFAAIAVCALLLAAEDGPPPRGGGMGHWGDLLFCVALGGVAFQSISAWSSRPGSLRVPPLMSATFGWVSLLAIPLLTVRGPDGFLGLNAGYPFAVVAFLAAGIWAGRILSRRITADGPTV